MKRLPPLLALAFLFTATHAAPARTSSLPTPAPANSRVADVQVWIRLDRPDWTYALGEPAKFHVTLLCDQQPVGGLTIRYEVGPEKMPAEPKTAIVPVEGLTIDGGTMREPGFLQCIVTTELNGRTYRGLSTAGFAPDKIQPTQTEPADFDAFWAAGKAELAQIPLDARLTLQPDRSTSKVDVYHVSFQNVPIRSASTGAGSGTRIYGMLCVPKGPGPFPAVLKVPGATVRSYEGDLELAEKGVITLEIGIHGIPVNLPTEIYSQLIAGSLRNYPVYSLDNKDAYYYRRVYLGCVRANDFLCSLEKWDGRNLVVAGHSQGGLLAIVTAALDPRVLALSARYPAYSDVTGYLHGRAGGWPGMMRDPKDGHRTSEKIATTAYYDAVNFARRLKVPGYYTWGYNDEVCPPTSMFAAYNVITAPKELLLALETGHGTTPEQAGPINQWIVDKAGIRAASKK